MRLILLLVTLNVNVCACRKSATFGIRTRRYTFYFFNFDCKIIKFVMPTLQIQNSLSSKHKKALRLHSVSKCYFSTHMFPSYVLLFPNQNLIVSYIQNQIINFYLNTVFPIFLVLSLDLQNKTTSQFHLQSVF